MPASDGGEGAVPLERLERRQIIPATPVEAWEFFSRPENLALITPPWLGFRVTSPPQGPMYAGMILSYTITPLPGLRCSWVTEITRCHEPFFFVDEQRLGPYRFWHHQHFFREVAEGTEVRDLVHYRLPLGILGRIASREVHRRLADIFDFRRQAVAARFADGRRLMSQ
jgi:ligand-binding SRPBCC domain-containing protein